MSQNIPDKTSTGRKIINAAGKVRKKTPKWLKITGLSIIALWAVVIVALQILLNSSFLTSTVNKYAALMVDGELRLGRISASMFKSFPYLDLSIDDFLLTYPHDRFGEYDAIGLPGRLRQAGRGMEQDTLAAVKRLSLSVNYIAALSGTISIRDISLSGASVYAHQFGENAANWNIFSLPGSSEKDSTDTPAQLPKIVLRHASMTDRPHIVYTNAADTVFATIGLSRLSFDGKYDVSDLSRHKIGLELDTLLVAGRLPADTLVFMANKLSLTEHRGHIDANLEANVMVGMKALGGRFVLPLSLSAEFALPQRDLQAVTVMDLDASIATLDFHGNGALKMEKDSAYIRAQLALEDCPVEKTVNFFGKNLLPQALALKTDAKINITASCDGWYKPGGKRLPALGVSLDIPRSSVQYQGYDKGEIDADIYAQSKEDGRLNLNIKDLCLSVGGLDINLKGTASDLLGADPLLDMDLKTALSLDTVDELLPEGMSAGGNIEAAVSGKLRLSEATIYNFSKADLEGYVRSDGLTFRDETDTVYAYLDKTEISLGKSDREDKTLGAEVLELKAQVDSLYAAFGKSMRVNGKGISMTMQNAYETESEAFGKEYHALAGTMGLTSLSMAGADSLSIGLLSSRNSFKISNQEESGAIAPILDIKSDNGSAYLRQGPNRVGLRDIYLSAAAVMRGNGNKARRNRILDSLARVYPSVPRDSLYLHSLRSRRATAEEEDIFGERERRFRLDESMAERIRNWDLSGGMKIGEGLLITPYFPIRNKLSGAEGSFNNNEIRLSGLNIQSGGSDLSVKGKLTGLRRALIGGRGTVSLDADITSNKIDGNELMSAYGNGMRYYANSAGKALADSLSDEEYLAAISAESSQEEDSTGIPLIIVPARLNASVRLNGDCIQYSHLDADGFSAKLNIRDRCLQITDTKAESNMGDFYFEGFYSTKSLNDIKAGFDLNLVDITADKVIDLFPAVDSILPPLKAFKGLLTCEMAATTSLDTAMNLIPSSVNGILKIAGRDLSVKQVGAVRQLAKMLMFKDKQVGRIQDMSVQGLISDSRLEIFPFVLGVDRYTLAMSGMQNFDQSFKYHISVLKSPLPLRFGINLSGNFDKWKWKLGKAKYKSVNVPVFTAQLDTIQVNLISSIHNIFAKGVDNAVRDNVRGKSALDRQKDSVGYKEDDDIEELDGAEMVQMDALRAEADSVERANLLPPVKSVVPVKSK